MLHQGFERGHVQRRRFFGEVMVILGDASEGRSPTRHGCRSLGAIVSIPRASRRSPIATSAIDGISTSMVDCGRERQIADLGDGVSS